MHTLGGVTNHYPRHVGDITLATFGLTFAEFGCYDRLLDAYYASEGPLPLDDSERWRMAGALSKADRKVTDYITGKYFAKQPDGWHNKRADEEIAVYRLRADTARRNGHAGGRPPNLKITDLVISGLAGNNPTQTIEKTNQKPVASNQEVQEPGADAPKPAPKKNGVHNLGSRLPDDWRLPEEWKAWALEIRPDWSPQGVVRESISFRDYWISAAGAKAVKRNWLATWRTWIRRSEKEPTL